MKLRSLQSFVIELLHISKNLLLALVRDTIESHKPLAVDQPYIARETFLPHITEKHFDGRAQ